MTTGPLPADTHVGQVTLLARDLPRLHAFYRDLLHLTDLDAGAGHVTLGVPGRPLLTLRAAPDLPAPHPGRPGLYHTAFLMPSRADLGRWLGHAAQLKLRIGSGDHLVSEAFYLQDPEGNGIEVYADRPRHTWTWQAGQVRMDTLPVHAQDVHAEGQGQPYDTAPAGLSVGHVHLKVGSAAQAAQFYRDTLGLDVVSHLPGAAFLSWGGYHHHLGLNEWESRGQPRPDTPTTGLHSVEFTTPDLGPLREHLRAQPDVEDHGDHLTLPDPWGNRITVRAAR